MADFNAKIRIDEGAIRSEKVIYDITGTINPPDNVDGWGDGITNPRPDQVTNCYVNLYFGDGSESLTNPLITAIIPFPNNTNVPTYLKSTDLTSPQAVFPDGICNFDYVVEGEWNDPATPADEDSFLSIQRGKAFFYHNVLCCIQQLRSQLNWYCKDPCNDETWKKYSWARSKLKGLEFAVECKKYEQAQKILEALQEFCTNNRLNCGC